MLLSEHKYRPIQGKVVTIARHTVDLTGDEMDQLLSTMGVPKRSGVQYEIDTETLNQKRETITQESFFGAFTDAKVLSLDINDYEGADIVCDIQDKIPRRYRNMADFVYDGGSLDNIFDVAGALRNVARMVRPGGRFFAMNYGGSHQTAYMKFSLDWFMDFFALNRWNDCKCYISYFPNTLGFTSREQKFYDSFAQSPYYQTVYSFNPYVEHATGVGYDCSSIEVQARHLIYCLAEKGKSSTEDRNPVQKHYRTDPENNRTCNESAKRFLNSPRPLFANTTPFDPETLPRIDSSDYPEQMKPVAVLDRGYLTEIGFAGKPTC